MTKRSPDGAVAIGNSVPGTSPPATRPAAWQGRWDQAGDRALWQGRYERHRQLCVGPKASPGRNVAALEQPARGLRGSHSWRVGCGGMCGGGVATHREPSSFLGSRAVPLGQFPKCDRAPWNLMATTAVIYPLALSAIHCVFWRHMSSDLTMEA